MWHRSREKKTPLDLIRRIANGAITAGAVAGCFFVVKVLGTRELVAPDFVPLDPSTLTLGAATLTLIPAGLLARLYLLWISTWRFRHLLRDAGTNQGEQGIATPNSRAAHRLVERHANHHTNWAATVAQQTSHFIVDDDPTSLLLPQVPASLVQIRNEEIRRCIRQALGKRLLMSHAEGSQNTGTIDPEFSTRPCTDALKMIATLYLDAIPIVERRLNGLVRLLPIVDADFASRVQQGDFQELLKRNLWLFYLDYDWIDQLVIHTPGTTRYDFQKSSLRNSLKNNMKNGQPMAANHPQDAAASNAVRLTPRARERLLQEAPMLRGIIEEAPMSNQSGDDLMFSIKFEPLIPRLQRYFDFDNMRRTILDFEMTAESQRLMGLMRQQAQKARTIPQVETVLNSMTSVTWQGFKEKDSVLDILVTCYRNILRQTELHSLAQSSDKRLQKLHDKIYRAVQTIGYPGQLLHLAQIHKRTLRQMDSLLVAARNPSHPRFHEAWSLLSSGYTFTDAQRPLVLKFIRTVPSHSDLAQLSFVQSKAIDAVGRIACHTSAGTIDTLDPQLHSDINATMQTICSWLVESAADLDVFCLFLDACIYMQEQHRVRLDFPGVISSRVGPYLAHWTNELGAHHSKVVAVKVRWNQRYDKPAVA